MGLKALTVISSDSFLLALFFNTDGKPKCVCGERKLSRLSDTMLRVWADCEEERWYWHSDEA